MRQRRKLTCLPIGFLILVIFAWCNASAQFDIELKSKTATLSVCKGKGVPITIRIINHSTDSLLTLPVQVQSWPANTTERIQLALRSNDSTEVTLKYTFLSDSLAKFELKIISDTLDNNAANDTATIAILVLPNPIGTTLLEADLNGGAYQSGTTADPDVTTPDYPMVYEIIPPTNFSNSNYGTGWDVQLILLDTAGKPVSGGALLFTPPNSGMNGLISYLPDTSFCDKKIFIGLIVRDYATNCTDFTGRWIYSICLPELIVKSQSTCKGADAVFQTETVKPGTRPVRYLWEWYDSSGTVIHTSDSTTGLVNYQKPGQFQSLLIVMDSVHPLLRDSSHFSFFVYDQLNADFPGGAVCSNTDPGYLSDTIPGFPIGYRWIVNSKDTFYSRDPDFTFSKAGMYKVEHQILTSEGCSDTVVKNILVNGKPTARIKDPVFGNCYGNSMQFKNETQLNGADTVLYYWDFGDGRQSTLKDPTHLYQLSDTTKDSTFVLTLVAIGDAGCVDTLTRLHSVRVPSDPYFEFKLSGRELKITYQATTNPDYIYTWFFVNGNQVLSTEIKPTFYFTDYYPERGDEVCLRIFNGACVSSYCTPIILGIPASKADIKLRVMPNPANQAFTIKSIDGDQIKTERVELYDQHGSLIRCYTSGMEMYSLSGVASGMYQVKVTTSDRLYTGRLVVVR